MQYGCRRNDVSGFKQGELIVRIARLMVQYYFFRQQFLPSVVRVEEADCVRFSKDENFEVSCLSMRSSICQLIFGHDKNLVLLFTYSRDHLSEYQCEPGQNENGERRGLRERQ
jgi:hypothetical protein